MNDPKQYTPANGFRTPTSNLMRDTSNSSTPDVEFSLRESDYTTPVHHRENQKPQYKPLANRVFSSKNLGLITLFMGTSPNAPRKRSAQLTATVRLNMAKVYLKFIIEALLYMLCTYIAVIVLLSCTKLLGWYIVPITLLCALQLAARHMNSGRNRLHDDNGVQHYSLTASMRWATKQFQKGVDYSANFALRLFGAIPEKIAQTSLLDKQMAHIPDYSQALR